MLSTEYSASSQQPNSLQHYLWHPTLLKQVSLAVTAICHDHIVKDVVAQKIDDRFFLLQRAVHGVNKDGLCKISGGGKLGKLSRGTGAPSPLTAQGVAGALWSEDESVLCQTHSL